MSRRTELYEQRPMLRQSDERLHNARRCPFCEAPKELLQLSAYATYVECTRCKATGPEVHNRMYTTDAYLRGKNAAELWGTE